MSFSVNTSVFRYNAECYLVFQSLKHTDSFSLHSPGQSYFPKMDLILPFPHWKIFIDFQSPTAVFLKYIYIYIYIYIAAHYSLKELIAQLSDSLWPLDCSPPGSSVHGILQARIPKWVAIPFSRGSFHPRDQTRSPTMQADSLLSDLPGKLTTISRRACYKYPFLGSIFKNCILIGPLFLSMQWHRSHSEMMFKHRFL